MQFRDLSGREGGTGGCATGSWWRSSGTEQVSIS